MTLDLKFDKLGKINPEKQGNDNAENLKKEGVEFYTTPSNARNICFQLKDGKQIFFNYSYLSTGEFIPEENKIILNFISHSVIVEGSDLITLYQAFINHIPSIIKIQDKRYQAINDAKFVVNQLIVNKIT